MSSFREKSKTETNSHLLCVPLDWTALYFSQFGNNSSFFSLSLFQNPLERHEFRNFEISQKKSIYSFSFLKFETILSSNLLPFLFF